MSKNYSFKKKQAAPSPEVWIPDGKEILRKIREDSVKRRSNPLEYFKKFLGAYWIDQSEEEVFDHWQDEIRDFPWKAEDILYCLDKVVADPPEDLLEIMRERGLLELWHGDIFDPGGAIPYTYTETPEWLKGFTEKLRTMYRAAIKPVPDIE
jgi:hypothetical protein